MREKQNKISICFSASEYKNFLEAFEKSSYTKMSIFGRRLLLGKPVRIYYRDRAFDEFVEVAIDFRKDISLILQRPEWNEGERAWLETMIREMHQLHIKIHDHVRKNRKNEKRPGDTII